MSKRYLMRGLLWGLLCCVTVPSLAGPYEQEQRRQREAERQERMEAQRQREQERRERMEAQRQREAERQQRAEAQRQREQEQQRSRAAQSQPSTSPAPARQSPPPPSGAQLTQVKSPMGAARFMQAPSSAAPLQNTASSATQQTTATLKTPTVSAAELQRQHEERLKEAERAAQARAQATRAQPVNDCLTLQRDRYNNLHIVNLCSYPVQYSYCYSGSNSRSFECATPPAGRGKSEVETGGTQMLPDSTTARGVQWLACRGSLGEVLPLFNSEGGKTGCY
jgi:hypothetical protein